MTLQHPLKIYSFASSATIIILDILKEAKNSFRKNERMLSNLPVLISTSECSFDYNRNRLSLNDQMKTVQNKSSLLHEIKKIKSLNCDLVFLSEQDLNFKDELKKIDTITSNVVQLYKYDCKQEKDDFLFVSLNPSNVRNILLDQVIQIGNLLKLEKISQSVSDGYLLNLSIIKKKIENIMSKDLKRPNILILNSINFTYINEKMAREIVQISGGNSIKNSMNTSYKPKELISKYNPDILIISSSEENIQLEKENLQNNFFTDKEVEDLWFTLYEKSLRDIYLINGSKYGNCSGPNILEAIKWTANIIQCHKTQSLYSSSVFENVSFSYLKLEKSNFNMNLNKNEIVNIEEVHNEAIRFDQPMYIDPKTQNCVFTSNFLRKRHYCCGNKCRHCPFGHVNVKNMKIMNKIDSTVYLFPSPKPLGPDSLTTCPLLQNWYSNDNLYPPIFQSGLRTDNEGEIKRKTSVVFWNAKVGSFLALYEFLKSLLANEDISKSIYKRQLILLTIQDMNEGINLKEIVTQAKELKLGLCIIPKLIQNKRSLLLEALRNIPIECDSGSVDTLVFFDSIKEDSFIMEYQKNFTTDEVEYFKSIQFIYPLHKRDKNDLEYLLEKLVKHFNAKIDVIPLKSNNQCFLNSKQNDYSIFDNNIRFSFKKYKNNDLYD